MRMLLALLCACLLALPVVYAEDAEKTSSPKVKIVDIAAGWGSSMALDDKGQVWVWGENDYGQLATGGRTSSKRPMIVDGLRDVKKINCVNAMCLALTKSGDVYAWGCGKKSEDRSLEPRCSRYPLKIERLNSIVDLCGGWNYAVAIRDSGSVWFFQAITESKDNKPYRILGFPNILSVARSPSGHNVAISSTGTVHVWGFNKYGQLGAGDVADDKPSKLAGVPKATMAAVGNQHTLILDSAGYVWALGLNANAQLGFGDQKDRYIPERIPDFEDVSQIAAAAFHSLALKKDGTVYGWGYNGLGQLGVLRTSKTTKPLKCRALSEIVKIATGREHSLALDKYGNIWGFGSASKGELTISKKDWTDSPVQILFDEQEE